jgi:serpin B
VLANALYFYGSWATPFAKDSTAPAAFHAPSGDVQADTMHAVLGARHVQGTGYEAAELAYDGGQVAMTIVLPDDGKLADVEAGLSSAWLSGLATDLAGASAEIDLALPKFRFTWGTKELAGSLQALGMEDAFSLPPADFSGMQAEKELFVSHVVHKAFVGVDEYGTEAAAATAVVMDRGTAAENPPKKVTIDRPFLFFVRDTATGVVLFAGKVVDPTK